VICKPQKSFNFEANALNVKINCNLDNSRDV